jgi:hypothetical protein
MKSWFIHLARYISLRHAAALLLLMALPYPWVRQLPGYSSAFTITAEQREALSRISSASLRGHLSFIASDTLQGRATPSPGLDLAGEYIAAQFRRAGLEPAGDDGYFQTARWLLATPTTEGFRFTLKTPEQSLEVPAAAFSLSAVQPLRLDDLTLVKIPFEDQTVHDNGSLANSIVITEFPEIPQEEFQIAQLFGKRQAFLNRMGVLKVPLVLAVDRHSSGQSYYFATPALRNPESAAPAPKRSPVASVSDGRVIAAFDAMPKGMATARVSINLKEPEEKPVQLRNVVGLLRGSDPVLKDSYILLTAHYDHIGARPSAAGDNIWNGANDNGSGTVSVIEIASALASLKERPRRSLVFMTFFGEEKGLLGSRYYGSHPIFPLGKTVAALNLEQVGRTDSTEGDQTGRASLTGFDYSDIGAVFKAAGELSGIEVYKHEQNSEPFFSRSDNQALAAVGIPSHTLCVAFSYPDYHGPADHWEKVNFENMAKTDRMVAIGLWMLASNDQAPRWNASNPRTAAYIKAQEQSRVK